MRRRRGGRDSEPSHNPLPSELGGRLSVLESTPVDAERRLLLVRCDNVEHLIMVGGPADLVVENDVRKHRQPVKPAGKPAAQTEAAASPNPAPLVSQPRPALPAPADETPAESPPPRAPVAAVVAPIVQPGGRTNQTGQSTAEPAVRPTTRNGHAGPVATPIRLPDESRRAEQAPARGSPHRGDGDGGRNGRTRQESDPSSVRRDPPNLSPARRPGPAQPPPLAGNQAGEPLRISPGPRDGVGEERRNHSGRAGEPGRRPDPGVNALPTAEVPWPQPDSLENEIVRALRVEPSPPLPGTKPAAVAPQPAASERPASHPGTTLGDLAERLEEALAREVQFATDEHMRPDFDVESFAFDRDRPEPARQEISSRPEAVPVINPAPEAEPRRDNRVQERHEEAPVISLNARRKEAVDPLEDEMARLLGELTGDTGRR